MPKGVLSRMHHPDACISSRQYYVVVFVRKTVQQNSRHSDGYKIVLLF